MCPLRKSARLTVRNRLPQIFAILLTLRVLAGAQQNASEYQVKAAYLYNFAKTTQWPAQALAPQSDFVMCVMGGDEEFVRVLRTTLSSKNVNGHALEIRHLRSAEELRFCHLAFFRDSERNLDAAIASLEKTSVLLVGETRQFLNQGGMISLVLADGKVTYEINSVAIDRAGLHYGNTDSPGAADSPIIEPESSRSITLQIAPEYPPIAAKMKLAGSVQLQALVRADGTVKQVRVLGGHPVLAEAAAQAVKQWRFEPGSRETTESVRISFEQTQ